ncbi:MAG: DUF2845 domain-containing protein, partial [Gammaproteobacteria bacterium]
MADIHPGAVDAAEFTLAEVTRPGDGDGLARAGRSSSSVPTHGSTILIRVKTGIRGPSSSGRRNRLIVAALIAGLAVSTVRADTFRCGTHVVRPGDTSFEVLRKCGRPASQQQISGANERFVEQWYYEPGPG